MMQRFPNVFKYVSRLIGVPRQWGQHAAGYVVSPIPLSSAMPTRLSLKTGDIVAQFDKVAIEALGFLKADLLGLRNLSTLANARTMVEQRHGVRIDFRALEDAQAPEGVWRLFDEGDTLGIFQMGGKDITACAQQLAPRSVMDLSTIVALYRPGVILAGMLQVFINRKLGREQVSYVVPQLEPILKDTYGVIVYQEQSMAICQQVAGYTPLEADHMHSEYEAKVVGQDPATDIAVIKIQAQGLQAAEFGDSTQVNAGEEVVAIGSPAGYYGTVTKGIVSGVNRRIRLENSSIIMNCIQIDAAINPGNSGGALFNMWGQVIGITSSKLASSDYEGIGFAVSIDEAKPVIEELMEKGYVAGRVKIGVTYYAVSDTTAEIYGIKPGICIVSINPDCDVANTDLAEGDIITEIDGKSTAGEVDIASLFSGKQAGDEVVCKVYRKTDSGDEREFEIKFKLMADNGGLVADSQAE